MKRIVLLPLDERPCNFNYPYQLFNSGDIKVIRPEKLGDKKKAANSEEITKFLKDSCKEADSLVISIDTLLYGGLIPSRLHHNSKEEIQQKLELIKELKRANKSLKIYAFQCIMRCPKYSSSDEEPDYYEECGAEIHKIGELEHKVKLGIGDNAQLNDLYQVTKPEYIDDYTNRREFNLSFNLMTLDYVKQGFIDFLIIPQDDSAKYGYTAMDQELVYEKITSEILQDQVFMYPGADEVAMTLLSRIINEMNHKVPRVFVKYASLNAPFLIPAYEDRSLGETIKYHILAAGCQMVTSSAEADLVLAISAPAKEMLEANDQPVSNQNYRVERNITELVFSIEELIKLGKPVTIGDNAFANGADLELISLLNKRDLLMKVAGYAGWNTSSNTIGTALSEGIQFLYLGNCTEHKNFLAARYVEDAGYCSIVRSYISEYKLETLGMNYFDVKDRNGIVSKMVHDSLQVFVDTKLVSISNNVSINSVYMPWRRMFEIDVDVSYKE